MTGRFGLVVGLVAVLALAGCGNPPQPGGLPSAPASSSPTPSASGTPPLTPPSPATTGTPEEQILAQYVSFTTVALPRAYAAPAPSRQAILTPVMMEPALSTYLKAMADLDRKGQEHKGFGTILSKTVQRSGQIALVTICASTTASGLFEKATGRQLTKGVPRLKLLATLKQDPSQIWKVSGTQNTRESC